MTLTDDVSKALSIFREGARTGDTTKFIVPLHRLLRYLDSSIAIEVAIQQMRLYLENVNPVNLQASKVNEFLTSVSLLGPEFSSLNPLSMPKDLHNDTDQSAQHFVEAVEYLLEAVNTRVEGIRFHTARRSIQRIIYAYLSEFMKTYDGPRDDSDTYINDPQYIQYRIGVFTPILEDIEKQIQAKASDNSA